MVVSVIISYELEIPSRAGDILFGALWVCLDEKPILFLDKIREWNFII